MTKMPQEVMNLCSDREASQVLATVETDGTIYIGVKGRLHVVDEETVAFAELAQIKMKTDLKTGQKIGIAVFRAPSFGYQMKGTFQEYQTSGALFDQWAKLVKERTNMELGRVGVIKIDEIYSPAHGSIQPD